VRSRLGENATSEGASLAGASEALKISEPKA
jgi:hypothetical protein